MFKSPDIVGLVALLLAFLLLTPGCGGASAGAVRPQAPRAPPSVSEVSFSLLDEDTSGAPETASTVIAARTLLLGILRHSGYRVLDKVTPDAQSPPPEATLRFTTTITKRSQIVRWVQNGKVIDGYNLLATLTVSLGERIIEETRIDTQVTLDEIEQDDLLPLVRELNASPKMNEFGNFMQGYRVELAKKAAEEAAAAHDAAFRAWRENYGQPCANAATVTACDALVSWMAADQHDKDELLVSEGRRILQEAQPRLATLRDDAAWLRASPSACLEMATEATCAKVKDYLIAFPDGRHRTEAAAAMSNLETQAVERARKRQLDAKREASLEQQRQADAASRARDEQARQNKQNEARQCRGACSSKCAGVLEQRAFQACVSECIARCP